MSDVSAIILAAGLSRRMGEQNKLLLPVNGVPMIRHMVEIYASISTRIIVVTGHEAGKIETALFGTNVMFAFNPDFTDGQASSVACGLRASGSEGPVLMGLGDQPRLELDDLHTLLEAHMEADPARISIPVAHGKRGNPIVIPAHLRGGPLGRLTVTRLQDIYPRASPACSVPRTESGGLLHGCRQSQGIPRHIG